MDTGSHAAVAATCFFMPDITLSQGCLLSFPRSLDCILSRLGMTSPSPTTDIRSVSDASPCPVIAGLGDKHADCPISIIITVPKFVILSQLTLSQSTLVDRALRGFPINKISCRLLFASSCTKNPTSYWPISFWEPNRFSARGEPISSWRVAFQRTK